MKHWNDGMMEYWKGGDRFKKMVDFNEVKRNRL
jgi:hypothetical protein